MPRHIYTTRARTSVRSCCCSCLARWCLPVPAVQKRNPTNRSSVHSASDTNTHAIVFRHHIPTGRSAGLALGDAVGEQRPAGGAGERVLAGPTAFLRCCRHCGGQGPIPDVIANALPGPGLLTVLQRARIQCLWQRVLAGPAWASLQGYTFHDDGGHTYTKGIARARPANRIQCGCSILINKKLMCTNPSRQTPHRGGHLHLAGRHRLACPAGEGSRMQENERLEPPSSDVPGRGACPVRAKGTQPAAAWSV